VRVAKSNIDFLLIVSFVSEDGSMTRDEIADYVVSVIQDPISRVPGVGEVRPFGAQYAMRVWLDPEKLASVELTPADVVAAIQAQNAQVSAGQFGGLPSVPGQQLNATLTAQTRLQTPEQFSAILLRVTESGAQVRLRDVARVELAGESLETESFYNGKPAGSFGVQLAAGANALETADAVRARIDELAASFPPGLVVAYPVDTTPFVRISIAAVLTTLVEAVVLVFLVMLLFLQSLRATVIPTIAVPVVLLGTLGVLAAFGYSINTLTMFAIVLAIGLLVDDAIVVVENVERVMEEDGLSPREATHASMKQITGALVGIGLVISAVFVPMAFFGGSVGVIYRQFSIALVSAMLLSVVVALTLAPALCATILKPRHGGPRRGLYGLFNRTYDRSNTLYQRLLGALVRRRGRAMLAYLVAAGALALLFGRMPTSFLPEEDQGRIFAQVLLPPGSTQEQTRAATAAVSEWFLDEAGDAVESVLAINGFSFAGRGQNAGIAFVRLRPWDERTEPELGAKSLAARASAGLSPIRQASVSVFGPPAISGMGNATGFQLQLEDRGGLGHEALVAARDQLLELAAADRRVIRVRANGLDDRPEYRIDVDQEKASALGLSLDAVNATLSAAWGGAYIDDFIDQGRSKRVYIQGDARFRMGPDDLGRWYVRNARGGMVPLSAFTSGTWSMGSPKVERYNGFPTVTIQGEAAPGMSSGDAMAAMEALVDRLPKGFGYEWSGQSYEERLSGSSAPALYALSLLMVFLCLAALYESWSVPFSVMLVVPLGVIGAVVATLIGGLSNDVYFKVGLLATVGLSAKNAILIVEFARELAERGMAVHEAALEAARQRLRPILMTSMAFVLGVLPLALADGAGAGAQNAIGVAVVGGVLSATVLGVLMVPVFFVLIAGRVKKRAGDATPEVEAAAGAAHA
jgi:hydrophobe/amphiphile efflux-1 (HAE1) family protein